MKFCSNCNIHFSTEGNFCERCGSQLTEVAPFYCPECGAKLQDGALFCGACGMRIGGLASGAAVSQTVGQGVAAPQPDITKKINILQNNNMPKEALIGGAVALLILLVGSGYYFLTHNDKTTSKAQPKTGITSIIKGGNNKDGNNTTSSGNNIAGNAQQAQPIRPGTIAKAYHSSADKEGSYIHSAALAVDGNPASCWSEGVPGLGIGENIVIHFNGTYKVSGMNIWIGHQKSQSLFYQNARPTSIRIEGSDGSSEVYALKDTFGAQRVDFKKPIDTTLIKIVVEQVVPGNKYQDTCIAEVSFF